MFGIGLPEMIVILVVALLVVGPDKLPELAKSLAKGVNELRSAMNQIKESLNEETKVISSVQDDLRKTAVQMKDDLLTDYEIGGPRRAPVSGDVEAEIEADLDVQPGEQEAAAATEAVPAEPDDAAAEERVIGKNPSPPPDDPASAA